MMENTVMTKKVKKSLQHAQNNVIDLDAGAEAEKIESDDNTTAENTSDIEEELLQQHDFKDIDGIMTSAIKPKKKKMS